MVVSPDGAVRFTVNRLNAEHPLEIYRFLRDEVRAERMQFVPLVEEVAGNSIRPIGASRSETGAPFSSPF